MTACFQNLQAHCYTTAEELLPIHCLGWLAGSIGQSFSFFGFQQGLSITAGALIVLLVILPKLFPSVFKNNKFCR